MNAIALSNVSVAKIRKHPKRETMVVDKLPGWQIAAPVREDRPPPRSTVTGGACRSTIRWLSLTNGYGKGVAKAGQVGKDWVRPELSRPPEAPNAFRPAVYFTPGPGVASSGRSVSATSDR